MIPRKLKALFILSDLESGGAQRVILTVFDKLNRRYIEPNLLILNSQGPLNGLLANSEKVYKLGDKRVRDSLFQIVKYAHKIRPDIIISTLSHLNIALILLKPFLPKKTALFIREANTPGMSLKYTRAPSLYFLLYRSLYHLSDGIICNSHYIRQDMERIFPKSTGKITVLNNPVDVEYLKQKSQEFSADYPEDVFKLVSVGMLSYQKGFDRLLKVMEIALKRIPNLHLTIVGGGVYLYELKRLVHNYGIGSKVRFIGYASNPYPYMAQADLFLCGSRWEGMPNAVLESLALGTPVIAFNSPGGIREIIQDGKNGWIVKDGERQLMADKICDVLISKGHINISRNDLLPTPFHVQNAVASYEEFLLGYFNRR